jgi:thiamine kinase-like enzyme
MDYYERLMPVVDERTFPVAFSHNDCLELNWLMNTKDNRNLLLIDYEYGGWNPMAMDLAHYLNETMVDGAQHDGNKITLYEENMLTYDEVSSMARAYLSRYYRKYMPPQVKDELYPLEDIYVFSTVPRFVNQIYNCALLNIAYWSLWAINLLTPESATELGIFNFDFVKCRLSMYNRIKEERCKLIK